MARFGFGGGFGVQGFAPIFGSESRNFTTLDSTGSKHYTIPTSTLTGDFEIEFEYSGNGADFDPLFNSTLSVRVARIAVGGVVQAYAGSNSVTGTVDIADGKLHIIKMTRVSTTLTLFIDGISDGAVTNANVAGSMDVDLIGKRGAVFLTGIIANVKITDAGTLKRFYKIDETWADDVVLKNSAVSLGSELGGTDTLNLSSFGTISNSTVVIGKTYLVTISADSGGVGTLGSIYNGAHDPSVDLTAGGTHTFAFTATQTNVSWQGRGSYVGDATISIKEAEGYGTAVNITSSDSETFTKSGDDWLGVELIISSPTSFGTNGSNTITNITTDSFDIIGDATVFFGAQYLSLMDVGKAYNVKLDTVNTDGELKIQSNVANELFGVSTATASYSFIAVSDGTDLILARRTGSDPLDINCTNISTKRILEGA